MYNYLMLKVDDFTWEPFKKEVVDAVDTIVLAAKKNGSKDIVQTSRDWDTMRKIVEVWHILFPSDYEVFVKSQKIIRDSLNNPNASAKDKGGAEIQHQLNLPQMLFTMIGIVFPLQIWDKKFVAQFSREIPMFKIPKTKI